MKNGAHPDWQAIKLDYIQNQEMTQESLAKKWRVTTDQVRGRAFREKWARARENYAAAYSERLQQLAIRSDAPKMLMALNTQVLKDSERVRVFLRIRLDEGGLSPVELRCVAAAFAELYRMDRLALGASTDNVAVASTQASQYDNMSEEELLKELRQVRERVAIE
jgi:hypothetical protein